MEVRHLQRTFLRNRIIFRSFTAFGSSKRGEKDPIRGRKLLKTTYFICFFPLGEKQRSFGDLRMKIFYTFNRE